MANLIFPAYSTIATEAITYGTSDLVNDLNVTARVTTVTITGTAADTTALTYEATLKAAAGMVLLVKLAKSTPTGGVAATSLTVKYLDEDGDDATKVMTAADDEFTFLSLGDGKFLPYTAAIDGVIGKDETIT